MKEYYDGVKLYGDDFSHQQMEQWYREEAEGYADLGSRNISTYTYGYNMMNRIHGFDKIDKPAFGNVLGIGSAWGYEFEPIINMISSLTIIEPSDNMISSKIGNLVPAYIKPNIDGSLVFGNSEFDLITCFGTLHHIPNVSFVLKEMIRVLKPDGYLLLREPIVTMGDWKKPRIGLTKNERGIPVSFFDAEFKKYPLQIVSKEYCFTLTSLLQRTIGRIFKKPIYNYKPYVLADKYLSYMLKSNVRYHSARKINKIAPGSIFYVIKKLTVANSFQ